MGTDIHPAVEVRRNGVWRYNRPKTPCKWYFETIDEETAKRINDRADAGGQPERRVKVGDRRHRWDRCKTRLPEDFYWRNYRIFALVGNVRNGSGFAGIYTHDPIPFIQDNRGVPSDISKEARAKLSNEHSEGWVTLAELKAYDYRQTIKEGGVLSEQEYLDFLQGGRKRPEDWSGSISGQGIVTMTEEGYLSTYESPIDLLLPAEQQERSVQRFSISGWGEDPREFLYPNPAEEIRVYIHASWEAELYEEVKTIPEVWIPYLEAIVPKGGTDEDVRVVFDFDS